MHKVAHVVHRLSEIFNIRLHNTPHFGQATTPGPPNRETTTNKIMAVPEDNVSIMGVYCKPTSALLFAWADGFAPTRAAQERPEETHATASLCTARVQA